MVDYSTGAFCHVLFRVTRDQMTQWLANDVIYVAVWHSTMFKTIDENKKNKGSWLWTVTYRMLLGIMSDEISIIHLITSTSLI